MRMDKGLYFSGLAVALIAFLVFMQGYALGVVSFVIYVRKQEVGERSSSLKRESG